MDDVQIKNQMINDMLAQQSKSIHDLNQEKEMSSSNSSNDKEKDKENVENGSLKQYPILDKETRDKFRELVNMYIQADDLKKKIQSALKEQNAKTKKLSHIILMFMTKYNADDLISSDGVRLRCKKTVVKEPLSAKIIKERIEDKYEQLKGKSKEEVEKEIFGRKDVEKVKLIRLNKNTRNLEL